MVNGGYIMRVVSLFSGIGAYERALENIGIDVALVNYCEILKDSYNIIEIIDESLPDYDFRKLYEDNIDNIIGMYISKINGMDIQDDMKNRALYLGIEALMK